MFMKNNYSFKIMVFYYIIFFSFDLSLIGEDFLII